MGEAVAAAAIQALVGSLIDVGTTEISRIRGLNKNARELSNTLQTLQHFLNDAETSTIPGEAVKTWLIRLQGAAFDADNVLDEINYHHLSEQINTTESERKKKKKAKLLRVFFFSSLCHCWRNRDLAIGIEEVNEKLKTINKQAMVLGLNKKLANAPAALPRVSKETDSFSTLDFVGRVEEEATLVSAMLNAAATAAGLFSVHAIWGMGGMGKTTLTRRVFNNQDMVDRFGESRIWVHVSQHFDPLILFRKVLEKLTSSAVVVESKQVILEKLQQALKGKTYLLVLDDVWNEDESKWEDFINSLSGVTSTKGNCIVVTTRIERVALTVRPLVTHQLQGLLEDECWSIIKSRAFDKTENPSEFETAVGLKISRKCHGLPLAANVVGGVLYKASEVKWTTVEQSWLSRDEEQSISEILRLSFDNLSLPSLKKCFAYCSIFPKGHELHRQNLVDSWMAEGFLRPEDQNTDMESLGERFFNVLLQNSLLVASRRDVHGKVETCVMHDLVHDLASSALTSLDNQARYLFHNEGDSSPVAEETAKYLRTYLIYNSYYYITDAMFSGFESLRNLSLPFNELVELPSSIRKLIHLRNLTIYGNRIGPLPDWIGELYYLQTLDAMFSESLKLPSTLTNLTNLRRLHIQNHVELPPEIGRLTNLQNLESFKVQDKEGFRIEELGGLKNLKGNLRICNLQKVRGKEEAKKARLSEKPNLLQLEFGWDGVREGEGEEDDEGVMEGLQPHPNLRKLGIEGFKGKRLPTWTPTLKCLAEITLYRCQGCEEIPMLGHLPNLKSISLWSLSNVASIGYSFYGIDKCNGVAVFPSLERISLSYMPKLREWAQVEFPQLRVVKAFPRLQSLKIDHCEKLESLPSRLLSSTHHLREIEIQDCSVLRELPYGIDGLSALERLRIEDCPNLTEARARRSGERSLTSLRSLVITNCQEMTALVESWLPALEYLELVELTSIKNLPMFIDCLARSARLKQVKICGLPKFMSAASVKVWPFGNLQKLEIDVSREGSGESSAAIMETVDGMLRECCLSLTQLTMTGLEIWECLPHSIQHLTALENLYLKNFGVGELPEWLGNLPSLERLRVYEFRKLRHLPSKDAMQRPPHLRALYLHGCPELRVETDDDDSELYKISHIKTISVDGRLITRRMMLHASAS